MKKLTGIILSLVLLLTVFAPCSVFADAVKPLTEIGEIEVDENAGYEISFVYEGKKYSIDYTEMDESSLEYVLDVFSDDNLVLCENQDADRPESGLFNPVTKGDNANYFFEFDEKWVFVTAVYPIEDGIYEGMFEYKDDKVYDELIEYLYNLVKDDKKEEEPTEEPTEKPTEKEDARKNLVSITDFEFVYSGEFYIEGFDDYFEWGVCSYKRKGEKKSVTVFYFKYGETDDTEYLFISDEIEEDTNTVIFDLTDKSGRQVTIEKNESEGVEFDQTVDYLFDYKIQVNLTGEKRAKSVVVSYRHKAETKFTKAIIDMEEYKESGRLPSELLDWENNVEIAEKSLQKSEENKEEIKEEVNIEKSKPKTVEEKADALNEMGLFKGTDKGYELEKVLTREEAAVLLVRLSDGEDELDDKEYEERFSDVPKSEWSFDYVMYCYENGITKGTGEATFSPDDMISTEQFVTLVLRLLGYADTNPDNALDKAIDLDIIDSYDSSSVFTRGDAVYIMYNCLSAETAEGKVFGDVLGIK